MSALLNLVATEARKILRNPARLKEALRPRRWRQFFGVVRFYSRTGNRWMPDPGRARFEKRAYVSYRDYLALQLGKYLQLDLSPYDSPYERLLAVRLRQLDR